jgi:hypothetical protein
MKKVVPFIIMIAVVLGLSGCLDPQDGSGGKLKNQMTSAVLK